MKDYFSNNSAAYSQYRPTYPEGFFEYLKQIQPNRENAWDCGTGNGQIAQKLAVQFKNVFATDISQAQIEKALKLPNIFYSLQPAEKTNFPDQFFDLIIVGQAVHWFEFDRFYAEVKRTAKDHALIVLVGYGLLKVSHELDKVVDHLYRNIIGSYWDGERKYIDENYRTVPFPFEELDAPEFENTTQWTFEHLVGYLNTWSAVKHYIKEKGENPLEIIYQDLKDAWGPVKTRTIRFPTFLRIGEIFRSTGRK